MGIFRRQKGFADGLDIECEIKKGVRHDFKSLAMAAGRMELPLVMTEKMWSSKSRGTVQCVTSANFGIPLQHLNGEVEQAIEYMSLKVRGESWLMT